MKPSSTQPAPRSPSTGFAFRRAGNWCRSSRGCSPPVHGGRGLGRRRSFLGKRRRNGLGCRMEGAGLRAGVSDPRRADQARAWHFRHPCAWLASGARADGLGHPRRCAQAQPPGIVVASFRLAFRKSDGAGRPQANNLVSLMTKAPNQFTRPARERSERRGPEGMSGPAPGRAFCARATVHPPERPSGLRRPPRHTPSRLRRQPPQGGGQSLAALLNRRSRLLSGLPAPLRGRSGGRKTEAVPHAPR